MHLTHYSQPIPARNSKGIASAISSITEASSLNFVEDLPNSRIEGLALLVRQAESKQEILDLEKEIDFLSAPSQVCMRHIDWVLPLRTVPAPDYRLLTPRCG